MAFTMKVNTWSGVNILLSIILLGFSTLTNAVPVQLVNPMEKHSHHYSKVIQCGAFHNKSYSYDHLDYLKSKGVSGLVVRKSGSFYTVIAKPEAERIKISLGEIKLLVPDAFIRDWNN